MGVSSKSEVCGNLCQCKANYDSSKNSSKVSSDNLFSPIKNKMKVLKKIKKRMGLGRFRTFKTFNFNYAVRCLRKNTKIKQKKNG